jgi:3-oxoacyl-(acyl-carrier-protein) synthase
MLVLGAFLPYMNSLFITAANSVTAVDLPSARLGQRFGRMDLTSQLALVAVEPLAEHFAALARDRIAIILVAQTSSLSTDVDYWKGRDHPGGPSPTLFTYTLPSAAIGEIAIRHRVTGPNLCFVGRSNDVLPEAASLIRSGEADGCICVYVHAISPGLAAMIAAPAAAEAGAIFLQRSAAGLQAWQENDRDMETLCANLRPKISTK